MFADQLSPFVCVCIDLCVCMPFCAVSVLFGFLHMEFIDKTDLASGELWAMGT